MNEKQEIWRLRALPWLKRKKAKVIVVWHYAINIATTSTSSEMRVFEISEPGIAAACQEYRTQELFMRQSFQRHGSSGTLVMQGGHWTGGSLRYDEPVIRKGLLDGTKYTRHTTCPGGFKGVSTTEEVFFDRSDMQ